ncbi:MAG TPA: hypothetical protein VIL32_05555 [Steroidobacteraceae bacterium]
MSVAQQMALMGSPARLHDDQIGPLVEALERVRAEYHKERELLQAGLPHPSRQMMRARMARAAGHVAWVG